ncbi:hypothetical protein RIF29_23851 [Crotalaria pallida]|uniref:Uncharacterized protein n=1 Tax=Crotalaria pallida TaxID=3830 RepID=A0AAN9HZL6_CROPI
MEGRYRLDHRDTLPSSLASRNQSLPLSKNERNIENEGRRWWSCENENENENEEGVPLFVLPPSGHLLNIHLH